MSATVPAEAGTPPAAPVPAKNFLPEIQGLRAVAVGIVMVFHVWPGVLPGGYVGVDVFFVISGYLITGLLAREALREGGISLVRFYTRRVCRLLPAALLVLATVLFGTLFLLSPSRWNETAFQIAASALNVQNWLLAWLAVDYLGAENAPSPVQHFWSLAIEEQFYLVWPLLMILAVAVARRLNQPVRSAFFAALLLVFVVSLALSVRVTAADPALSYFATHTRVWELAMGGLLALLIHRLHVGGAVRLVLFGAGVAAILGSALLFSPRTPFPGIAALAPTLGAALVILAGSVHVGRFKGLAYPLLLYVGDRSYSLYLWHWPLIVFFITQEKAPGLIEGLGILALTAAMAHVSFMLVEQPFRHPPEGRRLQPLAWGACAVATCVSAAGALHLLVAVETSTAARVGDPDYPGPAAILEDAPVPKGVTPIPPLAALKDDMPSAYGACHQTIKGEQATYCTLGKPDGATTIAIFGDSHALNWVPALERIAALRGWRLVTFTKSGCGFTRIEARLGGMRPYKACERWRENVVKKLLSLHPTIVVTAQSRGHAYASVSALTAGARSVWSELLGAGIKVIALRDTPRQAKEPGDCVAKDEAKCFVRRSSVTREPYLDKAAEGLGVKLVDPTDGLCDKQKCSMVIGNVIAWRDRHHLTASYSAALAPFLAERAGL